MDVVQAVPEDIDGFLSLAAEVEDWFGPMSQNPEFWAALERNIERGTALVVRAPEGSDLLGGLLVGGQPPVYRLNWLVVAADARNHGVGKTLVDCAISRFQRPCTVEVITFGQDNPAGITSGATAFYERLGFQPGVEEPPGPEGGSRQRYHLTLTA